MLKRIDKQAVLCSLILLILLFTKQFMFRADTRISDRIGMTAHEALGPMFYVILIVTASLLIVSCIKKESQTLNLIGGIIASITICLCCICVGYGAQVIDVTNPSGRVSMSAGSYLYVVVAFLLASRFAEKIQGDKKKLLISGAGILVFAVAMFLGMFDHIAVMKEYTTNKDQFWAFFGNHLGMSIKVVVCGILFGVPLGWVSFKHKKAGRIITGILDTIESIPSLALICVMMFPLAFLSNTFPFLKNIGISGVGATPVFCALFCYSLFQIVNSTLGALKVINKDYIDVARGMGMTQKQIFTKVELPIILPVIISGIRVSLIATILGVTIGSYIGYGGLGKFILTGISGFKIDIVMLGTIPTIVLVLLFDYAFRKLTDYIMYRRRKKGYVQV